MDNKTCIKCLIELNITLFEKNRNVCRSCRRIQTLTRRNENNKKIDYSKTDITKNCVGCNQDLNILFFSKSKSNIDGYNTKCKKCSSIIKKNNKNNEIKIVNIITDKICSKCNINKNISLFRKNKRCIDGYSTFCIPCSKPNTWTKEKQKESQAKYERNNKEKLQEKWRKQGKKINRRIRDSLNHRIAEVLLLNGTRKTNKTFNYIGCDKEFIKKWFEFLFEVGMSWENYGKWHIDHIIPCSSFDLSIEENKLKCFSWKNLRPCWAIDNIKKGNKILEEEINNHNIKVNQFINSTTKL